MSAKIDEAKNDADKFASMVLHYSHNAERYLKEKDYQKASEMMWGAMSCVIKTKAAKEKKVIESHRGLWKYVGELAEQEKNKEIYESFSKASTLHSNFYESNLDPRIMVEMAHEIARTIGRLMLEMRYRAP